MENESIVELSPREKLYDDEALGELSEEELTELAETIMPDEKGISAPTPKEKQDLMNFFNNVLNRDDTTKVSNLSEEELLSVRLMQRAGLYALEVDYTLVARYIKKRAEIILATGLSGKTKGGFFLQIVNTSKKLLETVSHRGTNLQGGGNRGWFKRRG